MTPASVDIKDYLLNGNNFPVSFFIGKEPEELDDCITLFDTGGIEQNPKLGLDDLSLQIRVKNHAYIDGWNIIARIKLLMEGIGNFTINHNIYIGVWATDIAFLKYDTRNNAIFIFNLRLTREPSAVGHRLAI